MIFQILGHQLDRMIRGIIDHEASRVPTNNKRNSHDKQHYKTCADSFDDRLCP